MLLARGAALLVLFLLGALVYFSIGPSSGQAQFDRSLAALSKVHSWKSHSEVKAADSTQVLDTVSNCPSFHRTTTIDFHGARPSLQMDVVRSGNTLYESNFGTPWTQRPAGEGYGCKDASTELDLGRTNPKLLRELGEFKKGDKRTVAGVSCREWTITVAVPPIPGAPAKEGYTFCIDSDDLPREIRSTDGVMVVSLSDFNQELKIDPPDMTAAASEGNQ